MTTRDININCDLGEGVSIESLLLPYIYSCSVACGGHYGDETSILSTLNGAKLNQVKVGAHPSYPDKENFGRKSWVLTRDVFQKSIQEQLGLYFRSLEKVSLDNHHIKAHGALYNDLVVQPELCDWYLEVINEFDYGVIYAPYNSVLSKKATQNDLKVLHEAFLDRNYLANGQLVSRSHPKALKSEPKEVWSQLKCLLEKEGVMTLEGQWLHLPAETFCLHGDHPRALEFLKYLHLHLKQSR